MCGQSKRLLGADAPSHRPRGVLTKRHAGFQFHRPELAARLVETRACMSCFAFSGPTPSSPSSPGSMAQHSLVQHMSRGGLPRRFGPLALELRLRGLPLRFPHFSAIGGKRRFTPPHSNWTPATASSNCYKERSLSGGVPTSLNNASPQPSHPWRTLSVLPRAPSCSACLCAMPAMPPSSRPPPTPNFADTRTLSRCSSPS